MSVIIKEFKQFLLRGNVVDMAVGIVIGASFGAVVTALVSDLLTPLISALVKIPDFGGLSFSVNGSEFMYGHFLNVLLSFILMAAVIFFGVVKPVNILVSRSRRQPPTDPTTKRCPECLSEVPVAARRCAHCTQSIS